MTYVRQRSQDLLRRIHLLGAVDDLRFTLVRRQAKPRNTAFLGENPGFAVPPLRLLYETHGHVEWRDYRRSGERIAGQIVDLANEFTMRPIEAVLEWGCGPARLVRHMPALVPGSQVCGCDCDRACLEWCDRAVSEVGFSINSLEPPLPYEASSFDLVYSVSVVTHLSEATASRWMGELLRILRPGGLLMLWTNGDPTTSVLLPAELALYRRGCYVERGSFTEGRKLYLGFHPPSYVRDRLLREYEIVRHIPGGFTGHEQDIWVARSPVDADLLQVGSGRRERI
jgi:SAM-dependent methyltransferase